jgi:hypothetical protein
MSFDNISTEQLMGELRRRVRCTEKAEKTMAILVRACAGGEAAALCGRLLAGAGRSRLALAA